MRELPEILGWEQHQDVDYASGDPVTFWLPPTYVPPPDHFPVPSIDDMLLWLHVNCRAFWAFGGHPDAYWGQIGFSVDCTFAGVATLYALVEGMVRYVDQYGEDLH